MRLPGRHRTAHTITFVTRRGCHLCEVAEPLVAREARRAGAALVVRDVDADPDATPAERAAWSVTVPVVLVDGRPHSVYEVDAGALRRTLSGR